MIVGGRYCPIAERRCEAKLTLAQRASFHVSELSGMAMYDATK